MGVGRGQVLMEFPVLDDRELSARRASPHPLHCPPFPLMKARTRAANEAWKIRLLCERIFHKSPSFRPRQPRALWREGCLAPGDPG